MPLTSSLRLIVLAIVLVATASCVHVASVSLKIRAADKDAQLVQVDRALLALGFRSTVADDLVEHKFGTFEVLRHFHAAAHPALQGRVFHDPSTDVLEMFLTEMDDGPRGLRSKFSKPAADAIDQFVDAISTHFDDQAVAVRRTGFRSAN